MAARPKAYIELREGDKIRGYVRRVYYTELGVPYVKLKGRLIFGDHEHMPIDVLDWRPLNFIQHRP